MVQTLQPTSDVQTASWDTPIWSTVDGAYDTVAVTQKAVGEGIVALGSPAATPGSGDHILRWASWISKSGSTITVNLYQGTTLIASADSSDTSNAAKSYTLTSGEVANITDYSALRIGVDVESYGGKGATMNWSWAQLEVPDGLFGGSEFKTWSGSQWVAGKLKRWTGSAWEAAQVQRYNGSSWEDVP